MRTWAAVGIAVLGSACAGGPGATPGPRAQALLEARSNSAVTGSVSFRENAGTVLAEVEVRGLAPNSEHGFHVHEKGDCSAPDAASAGGHFNPAGQPHGMPGSGAHHAGDMLNLHADASGVARTTLTLTGMTLAAGPASIVGRAVVVHRDPDDYASQPAGNSGPRLACGVISAQP